MTFQPLAFLIGLPPFVGIALLSWKMKREQGKRRYPFSDPLLRPPGESCRTKVEDLLYEMPIQLYLFVTPIFISLGAYYTNSSPPFCAILILLSFAFTLFMIIRLWTASVKIANYRLGFDGERMVGQELNQALARGWKVYHDIPFEDFNIDHIVVAPTGVFAVETKTRRKGLGSNSHRVRYDGLRLIFPEWEDEHGLAQALRNAKTLSLWLTNAVGTSMQVESILTLPGWLVDRERKGRVNVLNPKEIVRFVESRKGQSSLSSELIQRISYQIEQRDIIS